MSQAASEDPLRTADLFNEALDLPREERAAFLARAAKDEQQRAAVQRLLHAHGDAPEGFLPGNADDVGDARDPAGERIGSYLLLGRLGEGGMGTVYAARQGERRAALKVLRPDLALRRSARRRLLREAEAANA